MLSYKIVMVRHGESEWNKKNLFCGWYDSDLSEHGRDEAISAGKAIKDAGLQFDCAYTSVLTRAQETLQAILKEIDQTDIPVFKTWRLNERHYGGLTGLNKAETAAKYGETQVQIWRRSYNVPPPPMEKNHPYFNEIINNPKFAEGPNKDEFPLYESLEMTIARTLPYWNDVIVPQLKEGKRILIVAHGNSLRGIVKHLDSKSIGRTPLFITFYVSNWVQDFFSIYRNNVFGQDMSEELIMQLNLPTGIPFEYILNESLVPIISLKFLGNEQVVKKAVEAIAAQGKAK